MHMFDQSIKKRVASSLRGGGTRVWSAFHARFIRARDASEQDLPTMWNHLLDSWLPAESSSCNTARTCMQTRVWPARHRWARAYFLDAITLGMQSTQRVEGWHADLKAHLSRAQTVKDLLRVIDKLVRRKFDANSKSAVNPHLHDHHFQAVNFLPAAVPHLTAATVSSYAFKLLKDESDIVGRLAEPFDVICSMVNKDKEQVASIEAMAGVRITAAVTFATPRDTDIGSSKAELILVVDKGCVVTATCSCSLP
jgi:hypothetical protein